jgi:hypothetical protein
MMKKEDVMKTLWILFVILLAATSVAMAGIRVMDKVDLGSGENVRAGAQTLCIDGQKFVLTYGWASTAKVKGVAAGGGVSTIQVYEEKDGKVVPAKC